MITGKEYVKFSNEIPHHKGSTEPLWHIPHVSPGSNIVKSLCNTVEPPGDSIVRVAIFSSYPSPMCSHCRRLDTK